MQKKNQTKLIKQIILFMAIVIIVLLLIFSKDIINLSNKNKINIAQNPENELISSEPNAPDLSAGMMPVRWNGNCWELTTSESDNWYDYSKGLPAYIMLNDGTYQSKLVRDMTNKKLASENIVDGMGADIGPNDKLGSIYVWIPRFAYNENNEIVYVKQGCSVAGTWNLPSIFTYEIDNRNLSLSGIWVEYNPLESSTDVDTKVSNMIGENNQYGFIGNTIATNANNEEAYKTIIETYIEKSVGADASVRPQINVGVGVPDDPLNDKTNPNRTILKIVDTNKREPIQANINYNEVDKKIEIKVIYTANGISKILNDYGEEMTLTEENGIILTDTGNESLVKGEYNFTIIDKKGNKQKLTIIPNIASLFKVAYITGTDNMDNTETYNKAQGTKTTAETNLISQLSETDPNTNKNYVRAIKDANQAITAIEDNTRTDEDEQLYLYKKYNATYKSGRIRMDVR